MFKSNKFTWLLALTIFSFTLCSSSLYAQKTSFKDLFTVNLRNAGALMGPDKSVTGYYFFYETEKTGKKERKYVLQLMDQNLEKIGRKSITASKEMYIQAGVYNGELLAIKTVDNKEETSKLLLYNAAGERVRTVRLQHSFMDNPQYAQQYETMGFSPLNAVEGGFIVYQLRQRKGRMSRTLYDIRFIPNDREAEGWKISSEEERKEFVTAGFMLAHNGVVYTQEASFKGILSTDVTLTIVGHDMKTGEELFRFNTDSNKQVMAIKALPETDMVTFCGPYVGEGESINKDRPDGIGIFSINANGDLVNRHDISWQKDLSRFVEVDNKGRVVGQGNLMILDISRQSDGNYVITTEGYKVFNGSVTVKDIFVMVVDKDFKLQEVKSFEKGSNTAKLLQGISMASPVALGYLAMSRGLFGYRFSQTDEDIIISGYIDTDAKQLGTINFLDNSFSTDQIPFTDKASGIQILPAKPGYVMIMEYFRKEKRLDTRLEKISF